MCNQFRVPKLAKIKQYLNEDLKLPLIEPEIFDYDEKDVFPNQEAPVLLYQNNKLQLVNKNWGYPSPVDANKPMFNARIERFYEQRPSMWDESFAKQRCIILTDEFFEYAKKTYEQNGKKYHERYSFKTNNPITMIAGIYDKNNFAMVTTNPNSDMMPIHNRMPLVIEPSELRRWLFQNFTSLIDRQNISLSVQKQPHRK
ncbi:MAG: SOS response-associated peptidase family protein [Lactobacillus sp.]